MGRCARATRLLHPHLHLLLVHLTVLCCLSALSSAQPYQPILDYDDPAQFYYPEAMGVCQLPWRPVLKLDAHGGLVHGSVEEVRALSLGGHLFRIKLYRPEGPYLLNVDNANIRLDHVCGESLWHLSDNGTHISTSAEWRFHLVCTDGQVTVLTSPYSRPPGWSIDSNARYSARLQDARDNFGFIQNETLPMVWYVKEIGDGKPLYSHALDGTAIGGNIKKLLSMAKVGETRGVMRDRGYSFAMNNVVLDEQAEEINGQSVGHISQRFTPSALGFRSVPYYWFSSWTSTGRRDNSRWFVGTTQFSGHNNDFVALDWHVDGCWKEVYVNNQYGEPEDGSLDELIFRISLGHRVRVQYDTTVLEANSIRIAGQTVIAQSIEELRRRGGQGGDKYFFNTDTLWQWTTVHTTGTVKTYTYRVKDNTRYESRSFESRVRWMVDTRPWKRVFKNPPDPYSDYTRLLSAVRRGASIRFSVQQDPLAGFLFTNADNVRLDDSSEIVYAQCLRHVSDKKDPINEGEYEIQELNPFHWFLMISSDGVMAMSAWRTQARTQMYDQVAPEVNMTWFASH
ncbi:uncharacterized protein LOC143296564 [Babylonia areolata]|uniref:uncharacterized protein LOC143296564 n=1 Tax=Babylonia areolata TaxID=304850 RepID=UPI003FD2E9C1